MVINFFIESKLIYEFANCARACIYWHIMGVAYHHVFKLSAANWSDPYYQNSLFTGSDSLKYINSALFGTSNMVIVIVIPLFYSSARINFDG